MISIGNDIVALSEINTQRTNDIRFHSKFITGAELALHQNLITFESFVWLLWSVKESAYKYLKRLNPQLVFSPTKIVIGNINIPGIGSNKNLFEAGAEVDVLADDLVTGTVEGDGSMLHFKSLIHPHFIATVVNDDAGFQNVYWGIRSISSADHESQSRSVRHFLLNRLQGIFPQHKLSFEKSPAGFPILLIDGMGTHIPISFSHHHIYTSYSFRLDL